MAAGAVGLPEGRVVAAKRKGTSVPADRLRLYERLLAAVEGVESKSNFGSAYTAVNGNMYSMIS
jgi:hypothetical protein